MFRKLNNLFFYMRTIKRNIDNINRYFAINAKERPYELKSINIDNAYRIYTVLNFNKLEEDLEYKYGVTDKTDNNYIKVTYLDNEVKKFILEMDMQLRKIGLFEMVTLTKADMMTESSILVVMEYKFIKTTNFMRNLILASILMGASLLTFLSWMIYYFI